MIAFTRRAPYFDVRYHVASPKFKEILRNGAISSNAQMTESSTSCGSHGLSLHTLTSSSPYGEFLVEPPGTRHYTSKYHIGATQVFFVRGWISREILLDFFKY
jgi:hypothetical protein